MSQRTLRVFCLANGNLVTAAQVARFRDNLPAIKTQAAQPGPWLFAVYTHGNQAHEAVFVASAWLAEARVSA